MNLTQNRILSFQDIQYSTSNFTPSYDIQMHSPKLENYPVYEQEDGEPHDEEVRYFLNGNYYYYFFLEFFSWIYANFMGYWVI